LTRGSQGSEVTAVQEALGLTADGYYDASTVNAVRGFQAENGLLVDGIVGPQTSAALGLGGAPVEAGGAAAPAGAEASAGVTSSGNATLDQIAQCESGGDPTAVSADGLYRGKYQFTYETWHALGGTGDPAAAPEAEQDRLAAQLLAQSGTSPWPSCS
jgi:peptidoglycan hydrolase-like protein with peptidoglycan-binding domain